MLFSYGVVSIFVFIGITSIFSYCVNSCSFLSLNTVVSYSSFSSLYSPMQTNTGLDGLGICTALYIGSTITLPDLSITPYFSS